MGITKCILNDIGYMPDWGKFFITLGKVLYRDFRINKTTLKIIVTTPTESEIPALLACAGIGDSIFKSTNEYKDYGKIFEALPNGQTLYYMNNGSRHVCTFQGISYNDMFKQRAIKLKLRNEEISLIEDRWSQVQLSEQKEYKKNRRIKGDGFSSDFLKQMYNSTTLEKVKLLNNGNYYIVGNAKLIQKIAEENIFACNEYKRGQIKDFIRAKNICQSHDYTHSIIVSKRINEKDESPKNINLVIFTDATSYINKEEIYTKCPSLVCISRLDNAENLENIGTNVRRYLTEHKHQIETENIISLIKKKVDIPVGVEILAWREEK